VGKAGRKYASALFEELQIPGRHEGIEPIYSLAAFHKTFLECGDLTEYKAAIELVGDWKEWQRLKRDSPAFSVSVAEWVEELKVLLSSRAQERIFSLMESDKPQVRLAASKWVAESGYDKRGKGRPSKAQIEAERKKMAQLADIDKTELDRVRGALNVKNEKPLQ